MNTQTVQVPLEDLQALAEYRQKAGNLLYERGRKIIDRVIRHIPEPEWKPTEEQIQAYLQERNWNQHYRTYAIKGLKAARKALCPCV